MTRSVTGNSTVRVEGLNSFVRQLKAVSDQYPKEVKDANYQVAKSIRDYSRIRAAVEGGVARKASNSLRASRSTSYAAVTLGGARAPYALGAEFGALRYRQFKQWRGNQWAGWSGGPGYFLHPTIREKGPKIIRDYAQRLDELHSRAFPQ